MVYRLVVTQPFLEFIRGDVIADAAKIEHILASEYNRFVTKVRHPTPARPILWRDDFPTWRSRPRTAEKPRPLQQRLTELMSYHCFGSFLVSVGVVCVLPFRYETRILLIFLKKCP